MRQTLQPLFDGCMKGRTMYVVPFSMGPLGSPIAHIGIELSDSPYVAVNMKIMTRMGQAVYDVLGVDGDFVPCVHTVGAPLAKGPEGREVALQQDQVHRALPRDARDLVYGSGYGGNALLGKKCFALRIASNMGRDEGWLAEHMLILGVTNPEGKKYHVAAAFPSRLRQDQLLHAGAAGRLRRLEGHHHRRRHRLDQAQADGKLRAINPEAGYFGVAPGTNMHTNPNCMASLDKNVIFTNVALTDDGDVWWEGMENAPGGQPAHLIDWQGKDWTPQIAKETGAKAAHPNARFTVAAINNPALDGLGRPEGRGDRRLHLRRPPLHHRAAGHRSAQLDRRRLHGRDHGLGNHRRRRRPGRRGAPRPVRHAALHGLQHERLLPALAQPGQEAGSHGRHAAAIYTTNWFRKGDDGKFVWPGYGENMRVLKWMIDRIEGKAKGTEHVTASAPPTKT
jgi:phosphoenolpyruvate carboxykinase (GTP)